MATKILLIHTDPNVRKTIADFLRGESFEVVELFAGAAAAVEIHSGRFDLLICDFNLSTPEKLQIAFAMRIKQLRTPVIIITHMPGQAEDARLFAGITEFVDKPVDLEKLADLAHNLTVRMCRRAIRSQTWHVCSNCSDWPVSNFEELTVNPYDNRWELCNECRMKLQHHDCD